MLKWTITFLVISLIAGILGFTGLAGESTELARTLFFVSLGMVVVAALLGAITGRPRV